MIKKIINTLSGLLLLASTIHGEVVNTATTDTVLKYVQKNSLVLFNVSDTLYVSSVTMGSQQWRDYLEAHVKKVIKDPVVAERSINKYLNMIITKVPKRAAEDSAPGLIQGLQQQRIATFGITKKAPSAPYANNLGEITARHLGSIGIDFKQTLNYQSLSTAYDNLYSFAYGIIFTRKQPEGAVVSSFIKRFPVKPARVIMLDTSSRALADVETALKASGTEFVGLRYTRTDNRINDFSPDLGTIQFLTYMRHGTLLTDEEAMAIKEGDVFAEHEFFLEEFIRKDAK